MRLWIAILAAVVVAVAVYARWAPLESSGDLGWALCAARHLEAPYTACRLGPDELGRYWPTNPLTTALLLWPLQWLPDAVVVALLQGALAGLLAWALLRTGEPWRLLALLSAPFYAAAYHGNWPALILAAYYLPWLWPVALLAKPHAALPVAALRWSSRGLLVVAVAGLASLLVRPAWPWEWLATARGYSGGPALLQPWGPLLLLAALRWREDRARLLLLCAVAPMRGLYDPLLLLAVARTRGELLLLCAVSWIALGLDGVGTTGGGSGLALYWLVALGVVIRQSGASPQTSPCPSREAESRSSPR